MSLFLIGAVSAADNKTATDDAVLTVENDDQSDIKAVEDTSDDKNILSDGSSIVDKIDIITNDTPYDKNATIELNVDNENVTEAILYVDDMNITTVNITGGKGSYIIPAGTYNVGSYHIYAAASTSIDHIFFGQGMLNIVKADPVIKVDNVTCTYGEIVKVPVTVTDSTGKGISGDVIITIAWQEDTLSKYVKMVDGKAQVDFSLSDLIGIFSTSNSTSFNISAMFGNSSNKTSFNITALFGDNGTGFNISALFGNGTGGFNITDLLNGNNTGNFNITGMTGGNGTFNISSLLGGNSSFNFTNLFNFNMPVKFAYLFTPGTYNMTVTYLDSRNFREANATAILNITPAVNATFTADITPPKKYGDDTTVAITLADGYGKPIPNAVVSVKLDDEALSDVEVDENGTAQFTISKLTSGNYTLLLDYNGTNATFEFNVAVSMPTTLTTKSIKTNTVNVKLDGKTGKYLSVTLKDATGKVLSNKKVQISLNGKKHSVTTNKNGVAKFQINLAKAGVYGVSACFLGDTEFGASFAVAKVTVNKQKTKIKTNKKAYKFKAKAKKTIKVTLKNAKGKAINSKKITLKIKNKTFKATTNKKGVATIKVKFTKKGTYKVAAKFAGDNTYKAISKNVKIVIK